MPEGHTLHRHARQLARAFVGHPVASSSPQGRFPGADGLDGAVVLGVEAVGKHLIARFDVPDAPWVHVHLGLFGKFVTRRVPVPPPRGAVRWRLVGPAVGVDLVGPTDCARWVDVQRRALLARLGPDPLRADADPERFVDALARRRRPIGAVLLDQAVISGIGNVYRAEILHLLRLSPYRPASDLRAAEAAQIWTLTARALDVGVRLGRIVTTDLDRPRDVPRGARVFVYKRHTCGTCGGPVRRDAMEGRTLHWCPGCQGG